MAVRPRSPTWRPAVCAVAAYLAAEPVTAETLAQALSSAYRGNPTLGAERARQRADDESVPRALSGYFPSLAATVGFGPSLDRAGSGRFSLTQPLALGFSASQTITNFGRTLNAVRSAESNVLAGRETLRGTEADVLLSAATAYMDILRDRAIVELQRGNIGALEEVLRATRKRVELGDLRPTGQAQAEARLARGRADLAVAEANLVASRASYRLAVGHEPGTLGFPAADVAASMQLRGSLADGAADAPSIRSAAHLADAAELDAAGATAELLPTLGFRGSGSSSLGRSLTASDIPLLAGEVALEIPIYDGGAAYAQVRQAKEIVGQRRFELAAATDQVRADIRSAWGVLQSARASIPSAEAAIAANEVALAGVQREQLAGQRTILDVLNAQQELLNARTSLVTARRDRVVAAFSLLAATGDLTAARLHLPGPHYRPEVHYRQVRDKRFGLEVP